jgi:serine/threonine protein kinase
MSAEDDRLRSVLEQAIKRLAQAWKVAPEPDLAKFLPEDPADPDYSKILAALIVADNKHRREAGRTKDKEDYLSEFPVLKESDELLDMVTLAFVSPPSVDEKLGSMIGPYKVLRPLGEGGFGTVYLADQEKPIRRRVALKIIKAGMDTRRVLARFEAERQALAVMDHPNIAKVYDAGSTSSGRSYFAMEVVHGEPITDYCDKHKLTLEQRLNLFIPVCQAVQHAHQKGIVHRDIKPKNVLVAVVDDKPTPKIIDFGVAKAMAQPLTEQTLFTEQGQLIGTPEYMSPEQAEMSNLDIDTRSDIYSLGVLLYELLTGVLPFDRKTLRQVGFDEVRRIIREVEPPKPSTKISTLGTDSQNLAANRRTDSQSLRRRLRQELDWITMKTLEKDRTRRYATATALAEDIQRYLSHEPVHAGPPGSWYRARKLLRRHRVSLCIATGSLMLSAAIAALAVWGYVALNSPVAQPRAKPKLEQPAVLANIAAVTVNEGCKAENAGVYSYGGEDPVKIAASIGIVEPDPVAHTWRWSHTPDAPLKAPETVTITATAQGGTATGLFELMVKNMPPTVSADHSSVTVGRVNGGVNAGRYAHPGRDHIMLTASSGTVTQDESSHTWRWSYEPSEGPLPKTVTIVATDSYGAKGTTSFRLETEHVPPTVTVDMATVTVDKASGVISCTGKYFHAGDDTVRITALIGTITQDDKMHAWRWSYKPPDGRPSDAIAVKITAKDSRGLVGETVLAVAKRLEPPELPPAAPAKVRDLPPAGIALPSGERLTEQMLKAPEDWREKLFPDIKVPLGRSEPPIAYVVSHGIVVTAHLAFPDNMPIQGIFTCLTAFPNRGALHGSAAELDDKGQLLVLASYRGGKLDGDFRLWDTNHAQRYYGQYKDGKMNGLVCLFRNGGVQLIQECAYGKVLKEYLIRWSHDSPSVVEKEAWSAQENVEMNRAIGELEALEMQVARKAAMLRQRVRAAVRPGVPWASPGIVPGYKSRQAGENNTKPGESH